jgi:hypothetical protein
MILSGLRSLFFRLHMFIAMLSVPRVLNYHLVEIGEHIKSLLITDDDFMASTTFREQCARACMRLRVGQKDPIPYSLIGRVMGVTKSTVRDHYLAFLREGNGAGQPGRRSLLSRGEMNQLVEAILASYASKEPMRIQHIKRVIEVAFQKQICSNTLHHILANDDRIRSFPGLPMESNRMEVTTEQITNYFCHLFNTISGAPSHFVFNMDEMGHQDWADAKETVCYGPANSTEERLYYPVPRSGKRITLIACIATDGSFLRPGLVIARKTYDNELALQGYTSEKVEIYSQSKSFVDRDIFLDWFQDTFVAEVNKRRTQYDYNGPAFLIMDNCTAHSGPTFETLCHDNKITPIFLPPHSSNQLQPLDVSVFGITKGYINRANKLEKNNVQTDHIVRILKGFYAAASPPNIIETFRNAGISLILDSEPDEEPRCLVTVTPETARCILEPIQSELVIPEQHWLDGIADDELLEDPNVVEFIERLL